MGRDGFPIAGENPIAGRCYQCSRFTCLEVKYDQFKALFVAGLTSEPLPQRTVPDTQS